MMRTIFTGVIGTLMCVIRFCCMHGCEAHPQLARPSLVVVRCQILSYKVGPDGSSIHRSPDCCFNFEACMHEYMLFGG